MIHRGQGAIAHLLFGVVAVATGSCHTVNDCVHVLQEVIGHFLFPGSPPPSPSSVCSEWKDQYVNGRCTMVIYDGRLESDLI